MARETAKYITRRPQALTLLKTVKDLNARNIMRGLLNNRKQRRIVDDLNTIRTKISGKDMGAAVEMTIGTNGLYGSDEFPKYYERIARPHSLVDEVSSNGEVAFVCFHMNSIKTMSLALIKAISEFSKSDDLTAKQQLDQIAAFYDKWGISEFLNKKLVFYMANAEAEPELVKHYRLLTERMKLDEGPEPHFAAMELMNDKYPYFKVVNTWFDILRNRQEKDFRQFNAMDYVCPTPLCDTAVGAFLRKAVASSIVDELIALKVILSLEYELPESSRRMADDLDPEIFSSLKSLGTRKSVCQLLLLDPNNADELQIYRRSLAFLEYSNLIRHRNRIDRVLAPRLIPSRFDISSRLDRLDIDDERLRACLLSSDEYYSGFAMAPVKIERQTFTKTVEFLAYLKLFPHKASFDESEIRFIFDRTTALQYLVTHEELSRLHSLASEDGKRMISVLALALMKEKTQDEDTDFLFRSELQSSILENFAGSITAFFEELLIADINIAQFLATSLDRHTMQKLYMLIGSAAEADDVRHQILRRLGERMDHLPYIIEADRIRAHNQITKLKTEIDDSRVYVDALSFKRWIRENSSSYMREYRQLLEHSLETITKAATVASEGHLSILNAEIEILSKFDFVLRKAMETIFSQFCTNRLFGIDSYLGRRIRHNTLQGMMLGGVDSIIDGFPSIKMDPKFMRKYEQWLIEYKKTIEHLRVDLLQFKGENYKRAIFSSTIESSNFSTANIAKLRRSIFSSGIIDSLEDMIVRYCWDQFEPQLHIARRKISNEIRSHEIERVDALRDADSSQEVGRFVAKLRTSVHDRFVKLSDWFQVPEERTLSASVRQISDLITLECDSLLGMALPAVDWTGSHDLVIRGSSLHRLYDCLFVVIYNAYRHGKNGSSIHGVANQSMTGNRNDLRLELRSVFSDTTQQQLHEAKIRQILENNANLSAAMIQEGYSGLRKLLYLTDDGPEDTNVEFSFGPCTMAVVFSIPVEVDDGS